MLGPACVHIVANNVQMCSCANVNHASSQMDWKGLRGSCSWFRLKPLLDHCHFLHRVLHRDLHRVLHRVLRHTTILSEQWWSKSAKQMCHMKSQMISCFLSIPQLSLLVQNTWAKIGHLMLTPVRR